MVSGEENGMGRMGGYIDSYNLFLGKNAFDYYLFTYFAFILIFNDFAVIVTYLVLIVNFFFKFKPILITQSLMK